MVLTRFMMLGELSVYLSKDFIKTQTNNSPTGSIWISVGLYCVICRENRENSEKEICGHDRSGHDLFVFYLCILTNLVHPIEAHSDFINVHIQFFRGALEFLKVNIEIQVSCLGSLNTTEQNVDVPASHYGVLVAPVVNLVHTLDFTHHLWYSVNQFIFKNLKNIFYEKIKFSMRFQSRYAF
jgi:hypothetical protein